jgi:hypothetical protein
MLTALFGRKRASPVWCPERAAAAMGGRVNRSAGCFSAACWAGLSLGSDWLRRDDPDEIGLPQSQL